MKLLYDKDENAISVKTSEGKFRVFGLMNETAIISELPKVSLDKMKEIHQIVVSLLLQNHSTKRIICNVNASAFADVDAAGILEELGYTRCECDGFTCLVNEIK